MAIMVSSTPSVASEIPRHRMGLNAVQLDSKTAGKNDHAQRQFADMQRQRGIVIVKIVHAAITEREADRQRREQGRRTESGRKTAGNEVKDDEGSAQ